MKKTKSNLVFGAFVVACFAAVRCGGDDSASTANTTTGGAGTPTSGASGSSAGTNGPGGSDNSGGGGAANAGGGANTGGGGTANAGGGGAANGGGGNATPRDGGGGTMMGNGGTQVGGDSGTCPDMAPMDGSMCVGNVTCDYPGQTNIRVCGCLATGPRGDGGVRAREWNCGNMNLPRDAGNGGGQDAGARCPNGTSDGDRCMTPGEVCRNGFNGACACVTVGANAEWFCN